MSDHEEVPLVEVAFDLECTMPGPKKKEAHPKFGSKIVMAGIYAVETEACVTHPPDKLKHPWEGPEKLLIIGHNIKFDLLHSLHSGQMTYETLQKSNIYDTQVAEYLLSGQQDKMTKLEDLAVKYGGTVKDDRVKEAWAAGYDTDEIDQEVLSEYLKGDVKNTAIVYKGQMERLAEIAKENPEFVTLFWNMMDVTKALAVVEHNGMAIDLQELGDLRREYAEEAEMWLSQLRRRFHTKYHLLRAVVEDGPHPYYLFDPNSNLHVAALLDRNWAHRVKFKVKEQVGHYKNGKPKYKQVEHTLAEVSSATCFDVVGGIASTAAGNPVVDDKVLKNIEDNPANDGRVRAVARAVREYRDANKTISTYIDGLRGHIAADGKLYGNLNQCVTSTSRLSSSNPNLQNLPNKSDVKKAFVSRFGEDGEIVELDYSQLEVIALAVITGDPQLKQDIRDGRDLHFETGKEVFGWRNESEMDKETRRVVKGVNFGLIYGGTANGLAHTTGQPKSTVEKLINAFYKRYPRVKMWQNDAVHAVQHGDVEPVRGVTTKNGQPVHESCYESPTGRVYTFRTYDAPEWLQEKGEATSFSPTEIKNYMIQGTATGDIVPIALSILCDRFVWYHENDMAYLTNTVHDSILIDTRKCCKEEVIDLAVEVMESMPTVLKQMFNWDFDLPLKAEASSGPNWKDQEEHG